MKKMLLLLLLIPTLTFGARKEANVVNFTGTVMGYNMNKTAQSLLELHQDLPKETNIVLKVNSPGGRVFAGFVLMNTMKAIQGEGRKIEVRVTGLCASMCFSFLQQADIRTMYPYSLIMQHKVSPTGKGARSLDALIEKVEADRIGLKSEYWALISEANIYVGPAEAVKLNLIDSVATPSIAEVSVFIDEHKRNHRRLNVHLYKIDRIIKDNLDGIKK